jgi:hypothetical protein
MAPPSTPLLQTAQSVPTAAKTGPPLLQLRPALTAQQTRRQPKGAVTLPPIGMLGGTRKRSSHKAVTATKR